MRDISTTSIQYLKGVGPSKKKLFTRLGVESVEDALYLFPRRYEDRRAMTTIAQARVGEWQTIAGVVTQYDSRRAWYTKKHVCEVAIEDETGRLWGVWFNQPYISTYFSNGQRVVFYGKVDRYKDRLQMVAPEYEIIGEESEEKNLSTGRIVPVYPLTKGLTQRYLRRVIRAALDRYAGSLTDVLPYTLRKKYALMNLVKGLNAIHFPESFSEQEDALKRISFEEFFLFQVSMQLRKMSITRARGVAHDTALFSPGAFEARLPFTLTGAQRRAIGEVAGDMGAPSPMHRLLQGEVGAGKTVVALYGCLLAVENGCQAVIMAPTEVLAQQHIASLTALIHHGGFTRARFGLLTAANDARTRKTLLKKIRTGTANLIVGTHAVMQEKVGFKRLSYVVIDEQHKFGVRQRALLPEKGAHPDVLIMTATPIPRTLCLTLYGDLDISTLDEIPPGRGTTETIFFRGDEAPEAYAMVRDKVAAGQQAYIIYPIIEESPQRELKAAQQMFGHFQKNEFKDMRLGLVHGQVKRDEAARIMEEFKTKKIDILLATTIVEVGIDVPNATVMVIEHAERFGLSQLHQLRGRIGRGSEDAQCILIANPITPDACARIDAIVSTADGFKIAQQDLLIRGPGQFFGRHQHGLNELRVANPVTQLGILEQARAEASELTSQDPQLERGPHKHIRALIEKRYPAYLSLVRAG